MESLAAVPERRLHEAYRNAGLEIPNFSEVSMVSQRQQILDGAWIFQDFFNFLRAQPVATLAGTSVGAPVGDPTQTVRIVWITDNTFVSDERIDVPGPYNRWWCRLSCTSRSDDDSSNSRKHDVFVYASSREDAAPAMDTLFIMLSRSSHEKEICIQGTGAQVGALPASSEALDALMGQVQSPKAIVFRHFTFDEEQCHLLANSVSADVHLSFVLCRFSDEGNALVEALGSNQGPTKLSFCQCDTFNSENALAFIETLRVNDRLVSLSFRWEGMLASDTSLRALAEALRDNYGLETLILNWNRISDEAWKLFFHSLRTNSSLKALHAYETLPANVPADQRERPTPEQIEEHKTSRTRQILDTLKSNTVLSHIEVSSREHNMTLFEQEIRPKLEMNCNRLRVQALVEETNADLRPCVLGRALNEWSGGPAFFLYMALSENHDLLGHESDATDRMDES